MPFHSARVLRVIVQESYSRPGIGGSRIATTGRCAQRPRSPTLSDMDPAVPFCQECGRPGPPSLSGMHPGDDGLVRWTLYRCGHMLTEIVLEDAEVPAAERGPRQAQPSQMERRSSMYS